MVSRLRIHQGIELDASRVNRDWQATTDAFVRYYREQRQVRGMPTVEAWDATDGATLPYLVIEPDGRMYGGSEGTR
ncbi:MAG: hypothetical protein WBW32_02765 [Luteibacter sp.]